MKVSLAVITALLAIFPEESWQWPDGTYGLPSPENCPEAVDFDWHYGHRTQATEDGSYTSDDSHFMGRQPTILKPADHIKSEFCMKTAYDTDSEFEWQKGKYCVYKKGECPANFKNGFIKWDDADYPIIGSNVQDHAGSLPDGKYDENTKVEFCCRTDGYQHEPIQLPNSSPFYLLRYGDRCQEVEGMKTSEEFVLWAEENALNWSSKKGSHPAIDRSNYPAVTSTLYYCYYDPEPPTSRWRTLMIIASFIAAVAAIIVVILLVNCIINRCPKQSERRHNAESVEGAMLPVQTTVIYRPGNPSSKTAVLRTADPERRSSVENLHPLADRESRPMSLPPSYEDVMAGNGVDLE